MAEQKPSAFGSAITPAATTILVGELANGTVGHFAQSTLPVSAPAQAALDLKAPLASPALTGTPTAPTAAAGTSTTQLATTAFAAAAALAQTRSALPAGTLA